MAGEYLMAGRLSELDRLRLQARVWEPAGRELLARLGSGTGLRVLDVGCGALGWLRALVGWVGLTGHVVGTDIDESLLSAAGELVRDEGLAGVELVRDDLFASRLEPGSFDLVHARFQICPLAGGWSRWRRTARCSCPVACSCWRTRTAGRGTSPRPRRPWNGWSS